MALFGVKFWIEDQATGLGSHDERRLSFVTVVKSLATDYSWNGTSPLIMISNNDLDEDAIQQTLRDKSLIDPVVDHFEVIDLIATAKRLANSKDPQVKEWLDQAGKCQESRKRLH